MNFEHYQKLLLDRQEELTDDVHQYDSDVLESPTADVGDKEDASVSDDAKSRAADLSATANGELGLVIDALKRIEKGTYGKCVECAEDIPEARLEAVPWAPYCLKDQQEHDNDSGFTKAAKL